ncbi:MAG: class I SAM-dependent methyltransferase [Clostridium sp.]|jgi:ubiquinone/menaquinone biosynthesis C-methylase UbiE|uniref:class I SAM-dependent methyltransferase n=1 Tax=Clostridium sp. TaxID=1506 RepID=UPI0025BCAD8D|nr:class I SAM-dependent methyltransferase [Clostridium sp.]MCH3963767.1 class I SAM-dependent methyltransferase [Clostridium sp.]MCI1714908.1 class I SAM-dependent methyltransferase [Clostridium sp.]MCI1798903.1 class I SAM-dependent methyltransferase [Clostridium sp.]MCI1813091.1 class I SAM-dependent methyltransferase [Clostridium sp.]MCI1869981.1 class I SAM-dependent methyltransferase [Clostridium sp.]
MDLQDFVEDNWTKAAENYSSNIQKELNSFKKSVWTDIIMENAPEKKKLDILDAGTGPGFFAIILSLAGHRVTAVDCTEKMIEEAKKNALESKVNPEFHVMDSHALNFEDESFDLIVSRNVTWTLRDAETAYKEWKRVLHPGGKILIFDANWNLNLFDEKYRLKFERDEEEYEKYIEKYGKSPNHNGHPDNGDEFRRSMPMNRRLRPQWDFNVLLKLGFTKIYCETDIFEKVWDEYEKLKYKSRPMFMISVEK